MFDFKAKWKFLFIFFVIFVPLCMVKLIDIIFLSKIFSNRKYNEVIQILCYLIIVSMIVFYKEYF